MVKGRIQSLHFYFKFDSPFSPEDGWNKKTTLVQENDNHLAIQICQNQSSIPSSLSGKNMATFCTVWAIFGTNILVPSLSSFAAIRHKGHYRKILTRILKFAWIFWYHTYIFEKIARFPNADFNAELIALIALHWLHRENSTAN